MSATSPLELEHVIGWTGAYPQTLCLHPTEETTFFSALGASVVIGDVYDPHKQRFLRAHDADVTALDVSSTGRLCASGQRRSALIATGDATVHVWEVARGSIVYTLFGLTEAVQIISFSPDERFLVAASADNTIAIWDMLSGEQVRCRSRTGCAMQAFIRDSPRTSKTSPHTPPNLAGVRKAARYGRREHKGHSFSRVGPRHVVSRIEASRVHARVHRFRSRSCRVARVRLPLNALRCRQRAGRSPRIWLYTRLRGRCVRRNWPHDPRRYVCG